MTTMSLSSGMSSTSHQCGGRAPPPAAPPFEAVARVGPPRRRVRKTPRSRANFSLLQLYSHRSAWANLHLLVQPDALLAQVLVLLANPEQARLYEGALLFVTSICSSHRILHINDNEGGRMTEGPRLTRSRRGGAGWW
jgi:hypothetical protein